MNIWRERQDLNSHRLGWNQPGYRYQTRSRNSAVEQAVSLRSVYAGAKCKLKLELCTPDYGCSEFDL
ncbi:MAG: hypothetical protein QOJ64_501 [Acidobacteriota bacterium]|nr:hypothetical protein [Acidobacteriota bacterium]